LKPGRFRRGIGGGRKGRTGIRREIKSREGIIKRPIEKYKKLKPSK